jgi:class 3 adenylate cyclase
MGRRCRPAAARDHSRHGAERYSHIEIEHHELFRRPAPGDRRGDMSRTRRLAAILAADVAGYSRLMGADEEGTLERLKALRRELLIKDRRA